MESGREEEDKQDKGGQGCGRDAEEGIYSNVSNAAARTWMAGSAGGMSTLKTKKTASRTGNAWRADVERQLDNSGGKRMGKWEGGFRAGNALANGGRME